MRYDLGENWNVGNYCATGSSRINKLFDAFISVLAIKHIKQVLKRCSHPLRWPQNAYNLIFMNPSSYRSDANLREISSTAGAASLTAITQQWYQSHWMTLLMLSLKRSPEKNAHVVGGTSVGSDRHLARKHSSRAKARSLTNSAMLCMSFATFSS